MYFSIVKVHMLHRILCLGMAVLLLSSTSGLPLSFHLCGGHIASVGIFGDAPSCMEKMYASCHRSGEKQRPIKKKKCDPGCCTDLSLELNADLDLVISSPDVLEDSQKKVVRAYGTVEQGKVHTIIAQRQGKFPDRPPPDPLICNLQSLHQVWRL